MILYYSGTGNSEYAAKRIGGEIGDEVLNLFEKLRDGDVSEMHDWEEKEDGTAGYPEGVDASSVSYHQDFGWAYPNQFAGHPWEGNDVDVWEQYEEYNAGLLRSKAYGFTYDSTPVANELAACTSVYDQYDNDLNFGTIDTESGIQQLNDALYGAGLQTIMDEKQTQLDAWLAENGEGAEG